MSLSSQNKRSVRPLFEGLIYPNGRNSEIPQRDDQVFPHQKKGNAANRILYLTLLSNSQLLLIPGGVLHNFQYGDVHATIWGLKCYVNQYLGSVNYNMDKNSIFMVRKSENKEESWNLVRVSKY